MSDLIEIVHGVYPVMPEEPVSDRDFWATISEEFRSRGNVREIVLDLWRNDCAADSIMKIVGLTEDELEAIVPRSRWLVDRWRKCQRCKGLGGYHQKVRYEAGHGK